MIRFKKKYVSYLSFKVNWYNTTLYDVFLEVKLII